MALFQGFLGDHGLIAHPKPEKIAALIIMTPLAVWFIVKFVEPWRERRAAAAGQPIHHPQFKIGRWSLHGTVALTIAVGLEEMFSALAHIDFGWVTAYLMAASVTALWIHGVRLQPRRAFLLGSLGAASLAAVLISLISMLTYSSFSPVQMNVLENETAEQAMKRTAFLMSMAIFGETLFWGIVGAAGGLWLDLSKSRRPTIGLLILLLVVTLACDAVHLALGVGWKDSLKDMMRVTGWGLALIWCRASDPVFRRPDAVNPRSE
jgi:hypothetical protein